MSGDPAVRSIRVASTLNDRLAAIVREAGSNNLRIAELELRIGEAQQIYPEIWRHLDEARASLGKRSQPHGDALSEFDALRASERPGALAVGNIEGAGMNSIPIPFPGMGLVQGKSATFNTRGHANARDACNALMRAMPDVDWKKLEQDERAELEAVGSLKPKWWKFW